MRKSVFVASALAILALAGAASAGSLNPQPDPPGKARPKAMLNPQPLPPGAHTTSQGPQQRRANPGHAFNPQPDPPGRHASSTPNGSSSRVVMPALMRARDKPKN